MYTRNYVPPTEIRVNLFQYINWFIYFVLQVEGDDQSHEQAFATSFFVTVMSELGDKTFFMSAILAMHHSRTLTFIGATIGQTVMTLVAGNYIGKRESTSSRSSRSQHGNYRGLKPIIRFC